jgi:hypothetical protein
MNDKETKAAERTLEQALAHAENVKFHRNDHCPMCENPQNEREKNHAATYSAQLKADAYCVLLADEVERLEAIIKDACEDHHGVKEEPK